MRFMIYTYTFLSRTINLRHTISVICATVTYELIDKYKIDKYNIKMYPLLKHIIQEIVYTPCCAFTKSFSDFRQHGVTFRIYVTG